MDPLEYSEIVVNAMKSEKDAQPWYDLLKRMRLRTEKIKELRKRFPNKPDYQLEAMVEL
jgi:hypothetical protein